MYKIIFATLVIIGISGLAFAEPYIPSDDSVVLEVLPLSKQNTRELESLKKEFEKNKANANNATKLAKGYLEIGKSRNDPRYYGYASAVIQSFVNNDNVSPEVLVLDAIIKQYNHKFDEAIEILDKVLILDPKHVQAWLTRAFIYMTTGNYPMAKASCLKLVGSINELITTSCISSVGSLSGQAKKSYKLLEDVLKHIEDDSSAYQDELTFAYTLLAEIAERLGASSNAKIYFQKAYALNSQDPYLLAAYSDFLLENDHFEDVVNILKDKINHDTLLIRLAIAEKKLGKDSATKHIKELEKRFHSSKLRKDSLHLREEALFNLYLSNDFDAAFTLALENWKTQKEPIDLKILLESAIASDKWNKVEHALEFYRQSKLEDIRISKLIEQAEGKN